MQRCNRGRRSTASEKRKEAVSVCANQSEELTEPNREHISHLAGATTTTTRTPGCQATGHPLAANSTRHEHLLRCARLLRIVNAEMLPLQVSDDPAAPTAVTLCPSKEDQNFQLPSQQQQQFSDCSRSHQSWLVFADFFPLSHQTSSTTPYLSGFSLSISPDPSATAQKSANVGTGLWAGTRSAARILRNNDCKRRH